MWKRIFKDSLRQKGQSSVGRSSTGDRCAWPSVVEAVGRTSHGVPHAVFVAVELRPAVACTSVRSP